MKLNVKYFGMIAEWAGVTEQAIPFSGRTVCDLKTQLETEHSKLKGISYQVAVNQKIASVDEELNESNEIALLPPFAGG
ncbi:MAG: MoaD/ThiS family protein [Flavobacteriales bacterium]|jgi:molybdopterin converting factor small subunit|nr:MoaD/ThiS family protein [Flavobacteriales bacterium]